MWRPCHFLHSLLLLLKHFLMPADANIEKNYFLFWPLRFWQTATAALSLPSLAASDENYHLTESGKKRRQAHNRDQYSPFLNLFHILSLASAKRTRQSQRRECKVRERERESKGEKKRRKRGQHENQSLS